MSITIIMTQLLQLPTWMVEIMRMEMNVLKK